MSEERVPVGSITWKVRASSGAGSGKDVRSVRPRDRSDAHSTEETGIVGGGSRR